MTPTETSRRTLLLVDHGSRRAEANALLERIADGLRRRTGDTVRTAHLEIAQPDIGSAIDACAAEGAREVVVVPWFLGPGRHTTQDIPEQVARAGRRHPRLRLRIADPLGTDDALLDVLLSRAASARDV
ncbi:MAG: sirohydrochlorin chelatase [Myxococcota bacterium]